MPSTDTSSIFDTAPLPPGVYRSNARRSPWPPPPVPTPDEIDRAITLVHRTEQPSPIQRQPSLSKRFDRDVWLKLESRTTIRSFKHRGALTAIERIAKDTDVRSVVTASTGNHGQGIAYAAGRAGLSAIVYVPRGVPDEKLDAMHALGAEIRVAGENLGEAQQTAEAAASSHAVYLEDGENPDLMAGAATVIAEVLDLDDEFDVVLIPIGGGNLISGSLLARELQGGGPDLISVQSTAAGAATESWLCRRLVERECSTFAGGLATTRPGQLALQVMVEYLGTAVLVDDEDLYRAMGLALEASNLEIEGAAAAPIAALDRFGSEIEGERIVLIITGGWPARREMQRALEYLEDRPVGT